MFNIKALDQLQIVGHKAEVTIVANAGLQRATLNSKYFSADIIGKLEAQISQTKMTESSALLSSQDKHPKTTTAPEAKKRANTNVAVTISTTGAAIINGEDIKAVDSGPKEVKDGSDRESMGHNLDEDSKAHDKTCEPVLQANAGNESHNSEATGAQEERAETLSSQSAQSRVDGGSNDPHENNAHGRSGKQEAEQVEQVLRPVSIENDSKENNSTDNVEKPSAVHEPIEPETNEADSNSERRKSSEQASTSQRIEESQMGDLLTRQDGTIASASWLDNAELHKPLPLTGFLFRRLIWHCRLMQAGLIFSKEARVKNNNHACRGLAKIFI